MSHSTLKMVEQRRSCEWPKCSNPAMFGRSPRTQFATDPGVQGHFGILVSLRSNCVRANFSGSALAGRGRTSNPTSSRSHDAPRWLHVPPQPSSKNLDAWTQNYMHANYIENEMYAWFHFCLNSQGPCLKSAFCLFVLSARTYSSPCDGFE